MIGQALNLSVALCKRFEGFSAEPYLCPAGVPTIGYGATHYIDGRKVEMSDPAISEHQAEEMLEQMILNSYMPGVIKASPLVIDKPLVLAALTDFAYNLGVPRYRASTLKKRVDAEDWDRAAVEIKRWTRAGGRVLGGLVRRREAEAKLILESMG